GLTLKNFVWDLVAFEENVLSGSLPAARITDPVELDAWLAVSADGKITVYTGRVDLGTGVQTSFAQVIADELDVPFEAVSIVMGDTALTTDGGKSTASTNTARGGQPLVRAAAEARRILVNQAATRLNVPPKSLTVENGI